MKREFKERSTAKHSPQVNVTPLLLASQTPVLTEAERKKLENGNFPEFPMVRAYHDAGQAVAAFQCGRGILELDAESGIDYVSCERHRKEDPKEWGREEALIGLCAPAGAMVLIETLPYKSLLANWLLADVLAHVDSHAKVILRKTKHKNINPLVNDLICEAAAQCHDPQFRRCVQVLGEELCHRRFIAGDEIVKIITRAAKRPPKKHAHTITVEHISAMPQPTAAA